MGFLSAAADRNDNVGGGVIRWKETHSGCMHIPTLVSRCGLRSGFLLRRNDGAARWSNDVERWSDKVGGNPQWVYAYSYFGITMRIENRIPPTSE